MALTLYTDGFFISPYAFSVFVALEEKKLPFSLAPVPLDKKAQQEPAYRAQSLTGRVPAIEHDGFWLAESAAIVDYLDDVFPAARVLPADPKERARARMVLGWIRSDLMPIREERPTHTMFYARAARPLSPAGEAAAARLVETAERLVPAGRTSLFTTWSLADADLAFMLQRLGLNGHPLPERLRAFVSEQWARPSIQKWIALPRSPYVPYG